MPKSQMLSRGVNLFETHCFLAVTFDNNHICDYGNDGLLNTIAYAEKSRLDYVGAGTPGDRKRAKIVININAGKLAIINCCEREFSIADDHSMGTNPLDAIRQ